MYAIWSKLTLLEDLLLGDAKDVVSYLQNNYSGPVQQIRSMIRERAKSLKKNSSEEITDNSSRFRILQESDSPFDSVSDYVGIVIYSYDGKTEFTLNEHQCKRGDILIKDKTNISVPKPLRPRFSFGRQQPATNTHYDLLFQWYFKKQLTERFVGVGITYEQDKWIFDAMILGPESKQSPFSLDEHSELEMLILTWSKDMNNQISMRTNARNMLDEQLSFVKGLLETQRPEMEELWSSEELELAITTFQDEIQSDIDVLFHTIPVSNTFMNLRNSLLPENQLNTSNNIKLMAEIFESIQSKSKIQPTKFVLSQVWKQLKTVEKWLHAKDLTALFRCLGSNTYPSIESLFPVPVPTFLDQLGICPESDPFNPDVDHVGLLIYLYNGQDEFTLNGHKCQRGQILIRQKQNIPGLTQAPWHKGTSFAPLFIHEYLYEWYFYEKPNELFYGIGFVYEENRWKYYVVTYAGVFGIHSDYNTRKNNPMASDMKEQRTIDLALSALYINNKWQKDMGCMYTIDELESIVRYSFQEEIETINKLFESTKMSLTNFNDACPETLDNFVKQCTPKSNKNPISLKTAKLFSSSSPQPKRPQTEACSTLKDSNISLESEKTSTLTKSKSSLDFSFRSHIFSSNIKSNTLPSQSISRRKSSTTSDHDEQGDEPPPLPEKQQAKPSIPPVATSYQLWRELCAIEQIMLSLTDLNKIINYLAKKQYMIRDELTTYTPPDEQIEEYTLMAKLKLDAQLEYIRQLFLLKQSQVSQQKSNEKKKNFEVFNTFIQYYNEQIHIAKKNSK